MGGPSNPTPQQVSAQGTLCRVRRALLPRPDLQGLGDSGVQTTVFRAAWLWLGMGRAGPRGQENLCWARHSGPGKGLRVQGREERSSLHAKSEREVLPPRGRAVGPG